MRTASITVHTQQPIATIQPQLHGQFIEHLGTCIFDGIWVDEWSSIANILSCIGQCALFNQQVWYRSRHAITE